jgi:glycosyltransferase involved in cell wall biosynthesis
MRILINDHAGHPFQVQLSRSLARRGHTVLHTYCASLQTPRGVLEVQDADPDMLDIIGIRLDKEFARYSLFTRFRQERELGQRLVEQIERFNPDVIISANTPLGAQAGILRKCRAKKIKFVFWVQDLLGVGISKNLKKKLPVAGSAIGHYYMRLETSLLRKSDEVIVITEDFETILVEGGVHRDKIHVIHNWAPLEDIPVLPRSNKWAKEHGLEDKLCFLYCGTLGMKHNPGLLLQLAVRLRERKNVRIAVVSEGIGAEFLNRKQQELRLENLIVMRFQPFEILPSVLASADVLVAILEPDAGVFAVPSKVLTYMCAKRPLLLAVPSMNLAARIVGDNGAGIVVPPSNETAFINAAIKLISDDELRSSLASNGLKYARKTFNIEKITDRFEEIIQG